MSILTCSKDQRDPKADSDCLIVVEMFLILVCGWTEVVDEQCYCYLDNWEICGLMFFEYSQFRYEQLDFH